MALKPYSDDFLEVWKHYPNGASKRYAFNKFDKLSQEDRGKLLEYAKRFPFKTGFVPHLSTAINRRYFDDWDEAVGKKVVHDPKIQQERINEVKKAQKEVNQRLEVKPVSVDDLVSILRDSVDGQVTYENLKKKIRSSRMVGRDAPVGSRMYNYKKLQAQAMAKLWGKDTYMKAWNEINNPSTESLEQKKKKMLEQVDIITGT